MLFSFYVVTSRCDGSGDGYGRDVVMSFAKAREKARGIADSAYEGAKASRVEDDPVPSRRDIFVSCDVVKWRIEAPSPIEAIKRALVLLCDGADVDSRATARMQNRWEWNSESWSLKIRGEP